MNSFQLLIEAPLKIKGDLDQSHRDLNLFCISGSRNRDDLGGEQVATGNCAVPIPVDVNSKGEHSSGKFRSINLKCEMIVRLNLCIRKARLRQHFGRRIRNSYVVHLNGDCVRFSPGRVCRYDDLALDGWHPGTSNRMIKAR